MRSTFAGAKLHWLPKLTTYMVVFHSIAFFGRSLLSKRFDSYPFARSPPTLALSRRMRNDIWRYHGTPGSCPSPAFKVNRPKHTRIRALEIAGAAGPKRLTQYLCAGAFRSNPYHSLHQHTHTPTTPWHWLRQQWPGDIRDRITLSQLSVR